MIFLFLAFLKFLDSNSSPDGEGGFAFHPQFTRVQTSKKAVSERMLEEDRRASLVYEFNRLQAEQDGSAATISNGTASTWIRTQRPFHHILSAKKPTKPPIMVLTPMAVISAVAEVEIASVQSGSPALEEPAILQVTFPTTLELSLSKSDGLHPSSTELLFMSSIDVVGAVGDDFEAKDPSLAVSHPPAQERIVSDPIYAMASLHEVAGNEHLLGHQLREEEHQVQPGGQSQQPEFDVTSQEVGEVFEPKFADGEPDTRLSSDPFPSWSEAQLIQLQEVAEPFGEIHGERIVGEPGQFSTYYGQQGQDGEPTDPHQGPGDLSSHPSSPSFNQYPLSNTAAEPIFPCTSVEPPSSRSE